MIGTPEIDAMHDERAQFPTSEELRRTGMTGDEWQRARALAARYGRLLADAAGDPKRWNPLHMSRLWEFIAENPDAPHLRNEK